MFAPYPGCNRHHQDDITFFVADLYEPLFSTATGWGVDPVCIYIYILYIHVCMHACMYVRTYVRVCMCV